MCYILNSGFDLFPMENLTVVKEIHKQCLFIINYYVILIAKNRNLLESTQFCAYCYYHMLL